MSYLTLYAGLLLPWITGTLCLVAIERRWYASATPNLLRQAGYGFFLGFAGLFLLVKANHFLSGSVSWSGLMLIMALLAISLSVLIWRTSATTAALSASIAPHSENANSAHPLKQNKPMFWLTVVLLGWLAVHLLIYTVDIFTQPVYPWDAWLAWVYRAKAWYLSGNMTMVVSTAGWLENTAAGNYTIDAWQYPAFPSVVPYWAALSLGRWSETLVNVPVLFAAMAIGMALYGQCREYGLSLTSSVLSCYLLYTIPLFGTHIALAGYADIWMAGFSGLGFVALIRALVLRSSQPSQPYGLQMALALILLAVAVAVKNEGAVWLLAAVGMFIILSFRTRVPVMILVSTGLLILFGFAFGVTHINLPLIGTIGFVDERMVIPFIGNFGLEFHNIWRVYLSNFFAMGNWNLFWVLVLAAVVLAMRDNSNPEGKGIQRIGLTFICIFLATQFFIFGLTDQGLWADTFTAINRLPLHFAPALMFAAFIILDARSIKQPDQTSTGPLLSDRMRAPLSATGIIMKGVAVALFTAALVITTLVVYLSRGLPEAEIANFELPAAGLNFAFGSGHPEQNIVQVDGFSDGYALLSSGPVKLNAEQLQTLQYTWQPSAQPGEIAFFWRQQGNAAEVKRTELTAIGTALLDLASEPDWKGEIVEVGFLVAGEAAHPVAIGQLILKPDDLLTRLKQVWQDWTIYELRSQQSINFLQGGDRNQLAPLPMLMIVWLLTTLVLLGLWSGKSGLTGSTLMSLAITLFVAAWMLLDVRWTLNSFHSARELLSSVTGPGPEQRSGNDLDGGIYRYIQRLKSDVIKPDDSGAANRILVIGDENAIDYYLLRAKYHLLPDSAHVAGRFEENLSPESLDYVIYFGQPGALSSIPGWDTDWRNALIEVDRSEWGTVYRITP